MDRAMGRVEAALARIDAAAKTSRVSAKDTAAAQHPMEMQVRHALSELDGLIAELER